jgi:hypothetical protein
MKYVRAGLIFIVEGTKGVASADWLVLRLATALLHYGQSLREVRRPKSYATIGPTVHEPLGDYLDYALTVHLNVSLPDPLDNISRADIRHYCEAAWKEHVEEK